MKTISAKQAGLINNPKARLIKAIFNGPVESLGFIPQTRYLLWVHHLKGDSVIRIVCDSKPKKMVCEYDTLIAFLKNWDQICVV